MTAAPAAEAAADATADGSIYIKGAADDNAD